MADVRHPVIVDTDALIAAANTSLWPTIVSNLTVTTTNVCYQELKRHVRDKSPYAPDGTRAKWVHDGSKTALRPFDDDENDSFTVVTCVPRPHREDAGEESIRIEVDQHPATYTFAVLMDGEGKRAINDAFDTHGAAGRAVAPPFLLYLLHDNGYCSKAEFCEACGDMLAGEGWTGYQALEAAWAAIPIDCRGYIDDDLRPS